MKRKRADSSTETPRSTRSNTSLTTVSTENSSKRTRSQRSITNDSAQNSDVKENATPTSKRHQTRTNGPPSATHKSKVSNGIRGRPASRLESPEIQGNVWVEVPRTPTRKPRGLVSTPTKSRVQESPTKSYAALSPSVKRNLGLSNDIKVNGTAHLTPTKKYTKEIAEEVAEKEDGRTMTRGAQRMRLARNLGGEDNSSEEEEEDEEEEEEEGEEEEEEEDEEGTTKQEARSNDFENFFQFSARKKKSLTSNNTLSQLPTLTPQESTALLAGIKDHHVDEIKKLHDAHCQQFAQWKFEINHGYNILLFGYGSKRSLIEDFGREELAEEMSVLVINGYFPNLSLDTILTQILDHIAPKVSRTSDKLRIIETYLSEPLALLIHSLDSPVLRLPKNQQILSTLASHKY